MDAGFLSVVESGQYFMTKDTEDLTQFNTLALHQEQSPLRGGIGLILNQGNILSPNTRFHRKSFIFFVIHRKYIEKKMERFISGE